MLTPSQAHLLSMHQHINREDWLLASIELLRPLFDDKEFSVPAYKVFSGFASNGGLSSHQGQCWLTNSASNELIPRWQLMQKAAQWDRQRAKCKHCGYQLPLLKKFLTYGPPIRPKDKVEMEALGNWEEM